jgi:FkbM family methyltransferase
VPATHFPLQIHGFEPISHNIEILNHGLMWLYDQAKASVPNTQLFVHRAAVVGNSSVKTVPFAMCPAGVEWCGVEAEGTAGKITIEWRRDREKVVVEEVAASTVDGMAEKYGISNIDVLLIDTEGLDAEVMDGAVGLLSRQIIKVLEFEYHSVRAWAKRSLESVVDWLSTLGYDCFFTQASTLIQLTNCWHTSYEHHSWSNVLCVPRSSKGILAVARTFSPLGHEHMG